MTRCFPYEGNPRNNDEAVDAVAASIKEFGFKVPIIVDGENVIVAGHTRLKAAEKLGLEKVPVIRADDLTEDQVKAFRLADNKTSELAEWDFDLLEKELSEIANIKMSDFGFDLSIEDEIPEIVEVDVPEPPEEPSAKIGEIWKLGDHRLFCGDATSIDQIGKLMDGALCSCVVTDPPYNMAYEGAGNSTNRAAKRILNDNMPSAQFETFLRDVYSCYREYMEDGASIYVFYKELGEGVFIKTLSESGLTFKQVLIWVKNQLVLGGSKYQSMHEPFIMGCKGKKIKTWNGRRTQRSVIESTDLMNEIELREAVRQLLAERDTDIFRENKQLVNDLHPTMKPIRLLAKIIENSSNKNDIVLDLFGGSGSTLIACEQLGRRCYMSELDPRYIDVIIERWENFTGKKAEKIM